jgi:multicomponent Na+:H+ antiporter subunit B
VSRRARVTVFLLGAAGLGTLLALAATGLPDFGHPRIPYGDLVNRITLPARHVSSAVASIVFDVRGVDSMIEETILFAAVTGAAILLRAARQESEGTARDEAPGRHRDRLADRAAAAAFVGPLFLVGLVVIAHGHLSPGGGFQGGVVVAGALLVVFLGAGYDEVEALRPAHLPEIAEAAGVAAYALVGLAAVAYGEPFLRDLLPKGTAGQLLSGGTIPILDVAVGLAVTGSVVLLVSDFFEQSLVVESDRE